MIYPDFYYEQKLWKRGFAIVIGLDEVGRGAFAGPLIAAAAAMKLSLPRRQAGNNPITQSTNENGKKINTILKLGINDSKKLTARRREKLDKEIRRYFHVGIGRATVAEINRVGIVKATEKAMRRAVGRIMTLGKRNKYFLLIDAFHVKYIPGVGLKNQKGIVHGDTLSISIAAASIVAKVYRDGLMQQLSKKYKQYKWEKNKGYGTVAHRRAIKVFGICRHHRKQFVKRWK